MAKPESDTRSKQADAMLESAEVKHLRSTLMMVLDDLLLHDGFGHIEIDMKILKRGQKEILISCGKEYRFVVNYINPKNGNGGPLSE